MIAMVSGCGEAGKTVSLVARRLAWSATAILIFRNALARSLARNPWEERASPSVSTSTPGMRVAAVQREKNTSTTTLTNWVTRSLAMLVVPSSFWLLPRSRTPR
jgi:hypothetical protein